ncbi:MAG: hypothetical protein PHV21_03045 [Synergistaceae bacterium]|jgi:hypothetical protein|nr:hypothetical protein [Synergistaceae bacterium]MDD3917077.1 hypothetical protein [Synergistaceae bacterium]HOO88639.1 hypothetical protein [Synergistales bacterium]
MKKLLKEGPKVVNIGVEQFYLDVKTQKTEAVVWDWKPPAASGDLLSRLKKLKKGGN